ncbi:MAG: DUF2281 domain-containing protein [bacterium]
MAIANQIKKNILVKIEKLPEDKLQEVLDFVSFVLFKEKSYSSRIEPKKNKVSRDKGSILKFIGGISHGSLAEDIDKELYGA